MQDYATLTLFIKDLMKRNHITYKSLAERMDVSESTIKRTLNEKDGSIGRISNIAEELGVSFQKLVEGAFEGQFKGVRFSLEQEEFFSLNQSYFNFYMHLNNTSSIRFLKNEYNLSEKTLFKYLKALDKIGLLELRENLKYRLYAPHYASPGSHIHRHILLENQLEFMKHVYEHSQEDDYLSTLMFQKLKPSSLQYFQKELKRLALEFETQGMRDEICSSKEELIYSCISANIGPTQKPLRELFPIEE